MFIRKRDPRYKAHLVRQQAATAAKASGKSSGQSTPRTRPPQSANAFVEQAWQKAQRDNTLYADLEWAAAEGAGDEEEWECVACGKTFRSEAAWDSHERSKKHMQAVERLKREMVEDNEELGLGGARDEDDGDEEEEGSGPEEFVNAPDEVVPPLEAEEDPKEPSLAKDAHATDGEDGTEEDMLPKSKKKKVKKQARLPSPPAPELPSKSQRKARARRPVSPDDLGESVDALRLSTPADEEETVHADGTNTPAEADKPEISKRDKRRAREAAKKAKEEQEASAPQVRPYSSHQEAAIAHIVVGLQHLQRDVLESDEAVRTHQRDGTCCC